MIKIICVDKIKKGFVNEGLNYYLKQLNNTITFVEIKQTNIQDEENNILRNIKNTDYVICCSIQGKNYSTEELYELVEDLNNKGLQIVFVIGGSVGLGENVLKRSDLEISFSKMTFPHELFRLILVEQLYRINTIKKNMPYHK